jgi:hypothetical protein
VAQLASRLRLDLTAQRVEKALEAGERVQVAQGSAGGDKRDLRMIPVIGPGIESAIPFSRPDRAILRLDQRRG